MNRKGIVTATAAALIPLALCGGVAALWVLTIKCGTILLRKKKPIEEEQEKMVMSLQTDKEFVSSLFSLGTYHTKVDSSISMLLLITLCRIYNHITGYLRCTMREFVDDVRAFLSGEVSAQAGKPAPDAPLVALDGTNTSIHRLLRDLPAHTPCILNFGSYT